MPDDLGIPAASHFPKSAGQSTFAHQAISTNPPFSRRIVLVILGIISTHFSTPHRPSQRELRFMDLLARQAADFIERKQAEKHLAEQAREPAATNLRRCPIGMLQRIKLRYSQNCS